MTRKLLLFAGAILALLLREPARPSRRRREHGRQSICCGNQGVRCTDRTIRRKLILVSREHFSGVDRRDTGTEESRYHGLSGRVHSLHHGDWILLLVAEKQHGDVHFYYHQPPTGWVECGWRKCWPVEYDHAARDEFCECSDQQHFYPLIQRWQCLWALMALIILLIGCYVVVTTTIAIVLGTAARLRRHFCSWLRRRALDLGDS